MSLQPDHAPAARQLTRLLDRVGDDQLGAPTPCENYTLGDLIEHVDGMALAFTQAAAKDLGGGTAMAPSGDAARLAPDWRTRIEQRLAALVAAWRDPGAWEGTTQAGGIDLPAATAGRIALNELVIHGWDVARASGQDFDCDGPSLQPVLEFVSTMSTPGEEAGREGLFGPVVAVPADAPLLDRVIGLSGRDPAWAPS